MNGTIVTKTVGNEIWHEITVERGSHEHDIAAKMLTFVGMTDKTYKHMKFSDLGSIGLWMLFEERLAGNGR